jgi:hypothetical protein
MVTAFRHRQVWDNPSLRNNGQAGASGATDLASAQAKENTVHGIPQENLHTILAPDAGTPADTVMVQLDAVTNGGQIALETLDNTGAMVTAKPQVQLSQNDLGALEGVGRIAKWRQLPCYDTDGNKKQAWFAVSAPEDTEIDFGGGSGAMMGTINEVEGEPEIYDDYFVVSTDSGLVRVAKPAKLRCSITSQVIDGTTWYLSYTSATQRTKANAVSSPTYSEYQRITERYLAGDEIWFVQVDNEDIGSIESVSDSAGSAGAAITYLDLNIDGREWSAKQDQSGP